MANITTITANTSAVRVGLAPVTLASNTVGSNAVIKINSIIVSNTIGVTTDVTVDIYRGTTSFTICNGIYVPARSTLVLLGKDTALYLVEGDILRVYSATDQSSTVVASFEILS